MTEAPTLDNWTYYLERYGAIEALSTVFPDLAKDDLVLAHALAAAQAAELAIRGRMEQLCPDV